jgi:hypothetical protein
MPAAGSSLDRGQSGLQSSVPQEPSPREVELQQPASPQYAFQKPAPRPAPMPAAAVEDSGNPYQSPATDAWSELRDRRTPQARHGCLTAWLILIIIVSTILAIVCLFQSFMAVQHHARVPGWFIPLMLIAFLLNVAAIVCAVALFRWRKWGFYGYLAVKAIDIVLGMLFGNPSALFGIIGVVILLGLLHMGGSNKAWHNLE